MEQENKRYIKCEDCRYGIPMTKEYMLCGIDIKKVKPGFSCPDGKIEE